MNLMHATKIRPILWTLNQFITHRILADVLPLLCVTFAIAQAMMKTTGLKFSGVGKRFCQPVLPKSNPTLDGEFQITRRAEQM